MKYLLILTAFFLSSVSGLPKSKDEANSTLSKHGSHYLFKLDSTEGGKRNSRCTPCGDDPGDRRGITNHLDPEYRGNGADNLGYDWSPGAWGGPAFTHRMRNPGMQYPMSRGWDRGRGGRQMTGNWGRGGGPPQNIPFNCERCRMFVDGNRYGGNSFSHRMGRWQDDRRGFESEVATVTSPPIALTPEGRINYVPSPGGEMYWDGVSAGGTRWDGFSNGISWLGGNRPYDGSWRDDPRNRGYNHGPKEPDGYHEKGGPGNYRPWGNGLNRGPSWQPGKGYGDRWPGSDQDMRYYGYASQWNYGTTNQNGWNGQNMKWGYGGKNWDNRDRNGYYGGSGGSPPRGKYDEDGNPLPHGSGGPSGPSHPYGQGGSSYPYGQGGSSSPYGQGGSIQYGSGGSVYYDQGNYIFHYGNGGSPYDPSKYPQDGKPSPYPAGRPDYGQRPGLRPGGKPWDYNTNDRYDNREPAYSNINWIRPIPADGGYPKPDSHGKYPPDGYDDKGGRKPWLQRPDTGGYGQGRPEPGSGFPHGGTGYITGGVTHPDDRYPGGGYGGSRPGGYPGGSGHRGSGGGGGYPGGRGGYPGSNGGTGYLGPSGGSGYPGHGGGSGYPMPTGGSGYPRPSGGSSHPLQTGGSGYPAPSGGNGYPRPIGGNVYPARPSGGSGYPGPGGGSSYPVPAAGSGYPAPSGGQPGSGGGSRYPSSAGGNGYLGSTGGGYPSPPGGSGYPQSTGVSGYPGSGGTRHPGPDGYSGGYGGGSRPEDSGYSRPADGGHGRPGGYGGPERPGEPGPYPGINGPPPKGHYTGFITELDPNKYPSSVNIGQGGNRYPGGGSYPIRDKDNYPNYDGNRYPGGDRYPVRGNGDGYPGGGSRNPASDRDRYYDGNRYPEYEGDRYRPGSGDRFQPSVDGGDDGNAWNYGQDGGHKDGIYRRAGGSYPPYRGGPFYTSSYLASASTPAGSSQSPSESKTQNVTKADEVTKPTPESA